MNRYSHSSQNKNGDSMRISFIKYEKQRKYQIPKMVGMNVEEIRKRMHNQSETHSSCDIPSLVINNNGDIPVHTLVHDLIMKLNDYRDNR